MDKDQKVYIGTFMVVKHFRVSHRNKVLARNLTREEAMTMVQSYPDSENHMVLFKKQFWADKYFI